MNLTNKEEYFWKVLKKKAFKFMPILIFRKNYTYSLVYLVLSATFNFI